MFEGTGVEEDSVIEGYVDQVKAVIAGMIEKGKASYEPFSTRTEP